MIVIGQMLLAALVLGTAAAVLGTGRVTIPLVASTTLIWIWIPVVQLLTGLLLVRGARLPPSEALTRYFETGRYWSGWLLLFTVVLLLAPRPFAIIDWALATALIPAVLTTRALTRTVREVCGVSERSARRRALVHQAITHTILVLYFGWAVALWPRLAVLVRS